MTTTNNNSISGGVVHELPEDLRDTLASDAEALAAWEDLTPLARNEWICWAISVKKPETRRQHVERYDVDAVFAGIRADRQGNLQGIVAAYRLLLFAQHIERADRIDD